MSFNIVFSRKFESLTNAQDILSDEQFNIFPCPLIDIKPVKPSPALYTYVQQSLSANYIIVTSQYAVIELVKYYKRLGISSKQLKNIKICAVGPTVSKKLAEFGIFSDMQPSTFNAETLCTLFPTIAKDSSCIFFPKGNLANKALEVALINKGYQVICPIVYETKLNMCLKAEVQELFDRKKVDCFAFTSPSSVKSFINASHNTKNIEVLNKSLVCAIGSTTAQYCINVGLKVNIMPSDFTVEGMAQAIKNYFTNEKSLH